jgi:hypothetical protein
VGSAGAALGIVEAALDDGVLTEAVVPPLVGEDGARLRLCAMATHTRDELREAARVLARAAVRRGFRPGAGVPIAAAHAIFDGEAAQRLRPAA